MKLHSTHLVNLSSLQIFNYTYMSICLWTREAIEDKQIQHMTTANTSLLNI
ncbi:unnamed protein product [Prunus brigantina]